MRMAKLHQSGKTASKVSGRQWQQVLARDRSADGQFFYAVRSTRIYCKPSCPSRRPTQAQVAFFPTQAAAEAAGYRPCRRCEPDRTGPREDPQARTIAAVTNYLQEHADEPIRLADVARATGVGRLTILRGFQRVFGVSPGEYAKQQRLAKFRKSMEEEKMTITDAIYDSGFGSSSRLYENSDASLGMTPRTMRAGGAGETIRYCTAASPLGRMLVAATEKGVCSIAFGSSDTELVKELRERFSKAKLVHDKGDTGWLAEAVAYASSQMSEHPLAATFPLDVRATAFQQRVWKALQAIPRGETRSYGSIAKQLGMPTGARAVGSAIGSNPVALVVPCHRAIHSDGSISGYRWGVERKKKLLAAEKK